MVLKMENDKINAPIFRQRLRTWWKQLWCRHKDRAVHSRAFEYVSNPHTGRLRWGIMQRPCCLDCGKILGKEELVRNELSRAQVAKTMRALGREMARMKKE